MSNSSTPASRNIQHSATPTISVILAAYNAEKYISEAIDSILAQTFTDFELIVINDGSTDRTLEIVRGYSDCRLLILSNKENQGLAKSLNKGISMARGRYIARQDADDSSLKERLEKQVDYMEKHPEVALLGTATYTLSESGEYKRHPLRLEKPTFAYLLKSSYFVHGTVMFRASVFGLVGTYNTLFRLAQDYELWLRISKQFRIANLPDALYTLRLHSTSSTATNIRLSMLYRVLARELALGNVTDDNLSDISRKGIEHYYSLMPKSVKAFYYFRLAKKYRKNKRHSDAICEYRSLMREEGWSWKIACKLALSYLRTMVIETQKDPDESRLSRIWS